MRPVPGMCVLFLLPEGTVDTVSPGDGNQLLGNLAFPAHPHTDDLGRQPLETGGGGEAASCTPHGGLWGEVISSEADPSPPTLA